MQQIAGLAEDTNRLLKQILQELKKRVPTEK